MKENGFTLKQKIKARSRRYPTETNPDVDYADDLVLLGNTPAQSESLLNSQEQATKGFGLCGNSNKTDIMSFNQNDTISLLNDKTVKLADQFTYLGSNISVLEDSEQKYLSAIKCLQK